MADQNSFLAQLAGMITGGAQPRAQPAMLGSGMAAQAGDKLKWMPAYQKYSIDAQTNGERPMPIEQFIQEIQRGLAENPDAINQVAQQVQRPAQAMPNRGLSY